MYFKPLKASELVLIILKIKKPIIKLTTGAGPRSVYIKTADEIPVFSSCPMFVFQICLRTIRLLGKAKDEGPRHAEAALSVPADGSRQGAERALPATIT